MTRPLRVPLPAQPERGYAVRVGSGEWERLPALLEVLVAAHRYALITDHTVDGLHAQRLADQLARGGVRVDRFVVPPGEEHKSRESWARLTDEMLGAGLGRDAAVLAVGGGVVGDLAGFVAATFQRGIPLVQLPTTLLAMIDSSVGGKTGVDTAAGKNLVGAFHQPALVVADTSTLGTLPRNQLAAGLAEAIKHGAIRDGDYLQWIEERTEAVLAAEPGVLDPLVERSVEIKAEVVGLDEREGGLRKVLNFGHTIGHAVEALSGFRLLHGEAVAIGMIAEARIGEAMGVTAAGTAERLAEVLRCAELPTEVPPSFSPEAVLRHTRTDKKARAGRVEYALLERPGEAGAGEGGRWSYPVEDAVVLAALSG